MGLGTTHEDDYDRARVHQIAISAAHSELENLLNSHLLSTPAYDQLRTGLDARLDQVKAEVAEIYGKDESRILPEMQTARMRPIAAKKTRSNRPCMTA